MEFAIDITGVDDVLRDLARLPARLESKVLRKAARDVAKVVQADAKARVPRDTGAIGKGLKVRAMKGKRGFIGVRVRTPTRAELAALYPSRAEEILSSQWYYPAAVEYGYSRRGVRRAPAGFMRGAHSANRERASRKMRESLLAGLERETAKLRATKGVAA